MINKMSFKIQHKHLYNHKGNQSLKLYFIPIIRFINQIINNNFKKNQKINNKYYFNKVKITINQMMKKKIINK